MLLNKIQTFIDKYQKVLIVLFTLIGATFQVINLLLVSIDSIKFFSITSAINDSIIISINFLMFLTLTLTYQTIISFLFTDFSVIFQNFKNNKLSLFYRKFKLIIYLFIFIILSIIKANNVSSHIFFKVLLLVSFITLPYTLIFKVMHKRLFKKINVYDYNLFFGFLCIIVFSFIFPKFSDLYDRDIINLENYKNKILLDTKVEAARIQYFNDKYIFIIVKNNDSIEEQLLIRNTNDILLN